MKRSMNMLAMQICNTVEEAPNYNTNGEGFKGAELKKAIIVKNGMENGNDTVDLQFVDEEGNKYVALVTAKLLRMVTDNTITTNDD